MSRRRKILLGSLIGALADYRTRVNADGGVVEALTCANSLDADVVMIPSGYKATKLYSQKAVPVYGAEEVVNGDFATNTDWSKGVGWSIADGKAIGTNCNYSSLYQTFLVIGKTYKLTFEVISKTQNFTVYAFDGNYIATTIGIHEVIGVANRVDLKFEGGGLTSLIEIDNVSVKEVLTGDCDFDVSRNSIATRVNKLGLIEEVAIDVPRLDYSDSNCPSLLLEPQSTNLIPYSEGFSDGSFIVYGETNITLDNAEVNPYGELGSYKITSTGGLGRFGIIVSVTPSTDYTVSFYAKNIDASNVVVLFTNVTTPSIINYESSINSNGWSRVELSFTTDTGTSTTIQLVRNLPVGESLYLWGAQVEALPYATSYIQTAGSTVTRIADSVTGAGDANSFNSEEGVLYVETDTLEKVNSINISDGSTSNYIQLYIQEGATSNIRYRCQSAGAIQVDQALADNENNYYENNKIAFKWKLNDFALWVNGVEIDSKNSGLAPIGLNVFALNNISGGGTPLTGKVKALKVFKTALSDAELETLTT